MTNLKIHKHIEFINSLNKECTYNLSNANGPISKMGDICDLEKINKKLSNHQTGYSPVKGNYRLREKIAKITSVESVDSIAVFTGAQEAIKAATLSLLENNDEVVAITPIYPSLINFNQSMNIKVKLYELDSYNNFEIDFDVLEKLISIKTKMLIINFPNNPTGKSLTAYEEKSICDIVLKHNLILLSDEVYSLSIINDFYPPTTFSKLLPNNAISINVVSKSFGLANIRIAWVICNNKNILQKLLIGKLHQSICSSAIDEFYLEEILENYDHLINKNNNIVKKNLAIFSNFVDENKDHFYTCEFNHGIVTALFLKKIDSLILSKKLAAKHNTLSLPGICFYSNQNFIRIGLGNLGPLENIMKIINQE